MINASWQAALIGALGLLLAERRPSHAGKGQRLLPAETVNDLRRAAANYHVMKVLEAPEEMRVTGVERIGDRDAYTVAVRNKTYFFDVGSGLLVRADRERDASGAAAGAS